jgi:16S rRNA A1518/A1519 N6-dimethyltransferase RsmA/KsgA/DIM1 with predicted DNA glycosylase/AP lyase activity
MLRNGLRTLNVPSDFFQKSAVNFNRRPEELSVEDFVSLSNELSLFTGERPPNTL